MDCNKLFNIVLFFFRFWHSAVIAIYRGTCIFPENPNTLTERKTIWPKKKYLILQWKHCPDIFQCWIHRLVCFGKVYLISSMSYYSKMITEAFQVILKYVAPGQEDIVIQNVCKKLSFHLMILRKNLTQWLKHWMKLINSKMTG
jgi:hypothetical protein